MIACLLKLSESNANQELDERGNFLSCLFIYGEFNYVNTSMPPKSTLSFNYKKDFLQKKMSEIVLYKDSTACHR